MSDLPAQPPGERAARYRELADMHLRMAQTAAAPEARASHLELAALWTRLAAQADHLAHGSVASLGEEPRDPLETSA